MTHLNELNRVTFQEFVMNWKTLPQAPAEPRKRYKATDVLRKKTDLSGLIFGKLCVLRPVGGSGTTIDGFSYWCRCACLSSKEFMVRESKLRQRVVTDCGCKARWREKQRQQRSTTARSDGQRRRHARQRMLKAKEEAQSERNSLAALKRWSDWRAAKQSSVSPVTQDTIGN